VQLGALQHDLRVAHEFQNASSFSIVCLSCLKPVFVCLSPLSPPPHPRLTLIHHNNHTQPQLRIYATLFPLAQPGALHSNLFI